MRRLLALVIVVGLVSSCGCSRYELESGEPDIELSTSSFDFGAVERGYYREMSLAVYNVGTGTLTISDYVAMDGTSDGFSFTDPEKEIAPGSFAELFVTYTPTHEGHDAGAINIYSDDEDEEEVTVWLQGQGVVPHCLVDPTLLYYPLDVGESTNGFTVSSTGSGALTVEAVVLYGSTPEFTVRYPEGYEPPFTVDAGLSIDIEVTYSPTDEMQRTDVLQLLTSDQDLPSGIAEVELVAAGENPTGDNTDPMVEITDPPDGSVVLVGECVDLAGQVADMEEAADSLAILWHSSIDGYLPGSGADATGLVSTQVCDLSVGTHTITLMAFDTEGAQGSDTIELTVYEEEQELEYTISGGPTEFHYFHVDDDLTIEVNGAMVFVDQDGSQDHHAPVSFFAAVGDQIHIVAEDQQYCTKALDGLWLHLGGVYSQELNQAVSVSACEEHDDYDPTYNGPWPNTFLDETFTIAIP